MTSIDWHSMTVAGIQALPDRFLPGTLGYLTATSKVEGPVRDALATYFYEHLGSEWPVAREWTDRRDLAILHRGEPMMELEAKALYGFDVLQQWHRRDYLLGWRGHAGDVLGMAETIKSSGTAYLLSIVTHPMSAIPTELQAVIKYGDKGHNSTLAGLGNGERLYAAAQRWGTDLGYWGEVTDVVSHELGDVYGVPFRLDLHLVGPLSMQALERMLALPPPPVKAKGMMARYLSLRADLG